MDRKAFFSVLRNTPIPREDGTIRVLSGLTPYSGNWDTPQIAHLLRRTGFGAKKTDIDLLRTMTPTQAVDYILTIPATQPAPPVNNYQSVINDPQVPFGQTWVNDSALNFNALINNARLDSLRAWWVGQMLNNGPNIREKMTLFWHNHFATEADVVFVAQGLYNHYALLRQNCLGNFKTLTKLVTLDAAMLRYLNGELNSALAPDENYARELQELFTVGKGADALWNEEDVKEAAKVLTGYRINFLTLQYYFDSAQHHTGNKQFSTFYNNTVIQGQLGQSGQNELDALLNMIFATEEVAKHLCRQLYRFFVYYKIDSTVEANVIVPLADLFRQSGYQMLPVLDALFKSEHFFDTLQLGCVIKNPLDYVIGACREFVPTLPPSSQIAAQYNHWRALYRQAAQMNMNIGDPPVVSGWPAYYQQPMYHQIWIDSDTISKRVGLADALLSSGLNDNGAVIAFDPIPFVSAFPAAGNPNALVDYAAEYMYAIPLGPNLKAYLKSYLLSGQTDDSYWTDAWIAYVQDPTPTNLNIVQTRLKAFFKALMQQPEYELS